MSEFSSRQTDKIQDGGDIDLQASSLKAPSPLEALHEFQENRSERSVSESIGDLVAIAQMVDPQASYHKGYSEESGERYYFNMPSTGPSELIANYGAEFVDRLETFLGKHLKSLNPN